MSNRIVGLALLGLGLWSARWSYKCFKEGNMTLSTLAPAHRDKQPISFWISTAVMAALTIMGAVGGLAALLAPAA